MVATMTGDYFDRLYLFNIGPQRTYFKRFWKENVVVKRKEGTHGPNGYEEGQEIEVLSTIGDLQDDRQTLKQYAAGYENASAILYCKDPITDVEIGDTVDVVAASRNVTGAVEGIIYDNNALVLDL